VDEKFRKLQRNYLQQPADTETAASYIRILEQRLGVTPEDKRKIQVTDPTIPCLLCEKPIPKEHVVTLMPDEPWVEIVERNTPGREGTPSVRMNNPWQGVSVSTYGNYGSQVLDMHSIYFYICDGCIIRHSHKMFHYGDEYDRGEGIQNARDHFEAWFKGLKEHRAKEDPDGKQEDTYMQAVSPYFDDF
jgi:hypothetical protein